MESSIFFLQRDELLTAHQQLEDIIDFLPDATFVIDGEGRVTAWNRAIEEMTGVPKIEMMGKGNYAYSLPIYGTHRSGLLESLDCGENELAKIYQKVQKCGSAVYAEVFAPALYNGKGGLLWLKATRLFDRDGQQIGAIESIRDLTEHYRVEEALQLNYEKLRRSLESTINAMSKIIEVRDPYTAGHQQGVATLTCSIAKEMRLAEEQIEGLRVASILHDLGKIYIPAEILCKPTHLNEAELMIIKTHPRVAYDILKTIDFPWPVAEIVLQHHERMNGSGYPYQLSGQDILLEARILGVADVVEAISHHRPYRPALGIELAMAEIQSQQEILYDREVVEACLGIKSKGELEFLKYTI